jgi:hypothetical protein
MVMNGKTPIILFKKQIEEEVLKILNARIVVKNQKKETNLIQTNLTNPSLINLELSI